MTKMTNKNNLRLKQTGFSLVELAVVLAVVGVLAIGSVSLYSEQRTHVLWQEGDSKLAFVKSSLLKFVRINKFMPCPDTNGNGFENRTARACSGDTGTVPFNDLGLSSADIKDSWGNTFIYAVNQSSTTATNMVDCFISLNSACYFNNAAPPQFNLDTLPVMGNLGVGNLKVCSGSSCSAGTTGASVNGDALIAVLVAKNENGSVAFASLDNAEQENSDGDAFFVQDNYSESPYYDDLVITISANELKDRFETEIIALVNPGGPSGLASANPFDGVTVDIAGGNGDNDRFADNIGVNIESGTLQFGADNAGKTVTLTFKALVTGGWEDADALAEGADAQKNSSGKLETQDKFIVGLNSNVAEDLYTIAEATNPVDGRVDVDLIQGYMGNPSEDQIFYYDENDDADNTWTEYASYNVELDANGDLKVDFAVFSTEVQEKVQVSDVQAVLYTAPTALPDMPEMTPITGISQTDRFE